MGEYGASTQWWGIDGPEIMLTPVEHGGTLFYAII